MKKYILILAAVGLMIGLSGCQSDNETKTGDVKIDQATTTPATPVVDHGFPESKGPTAGPETIKGPTTPPPVDSTQAQAVTTKENIRLTLPRATVGN